MTIPTTRSLPAPEQPDIATFVAAVRAHLDDLSPDEVNELTGGLEADLTDALAEEGTTASELYGHPAEYAGELRAAAGLPPRGPGRGRAGGGDRFASRLVAQMRDDEARLRGQLESRTWWPAVRDFLVVLRPAWWVLRAWVLVQVLIQVMQGGMSDDAALVRGGFFGFLLQLAAIVASVQLGRGRLLPDRRRGAVIAIVNGLALVLLPIALTSLPKQYQDAYAVSSEGDPEPGAGVTLAGTPVTNVFPYDAQGRPLTGVQLYDQDGHPLEIGADSRTTYTDNGDEVESVAGTADGTPPRWNVFPLRQRTIGGQVDQNGTGEPVYSPPVEARLPFAAVPPLIAAPTPGASASSTPGAAITPTSTASPAATPKPSATK
jgi:hypothetical protein